jgi:hypothetical protein
MYRRRSPRKLQRPITIDGSVVLTAPFLRSLVLVTLALVVGFIGLTSSAEAEETLLAHGDCFEGPIARY